MIQFLNERKGISKNLPNLLLWRGIKGEVKKVNRFLEMSYRS